jgi:nucleoside-diphosphate-sugar epimerase
VLITGGAGYIGSILTRKLLERGCQVTVLDNLTYSAAGLRGLPHAERLRLIEGDIRDPRAVREATRGAAAVVHLAAIANDPSGELDPRLTEDVNYRCYPLLIDASREQRVARFLNASSFGVYGRKDAIDITEDEPLNPLKPYSFWKARGEELLRDAASPDFATLSLRCATVCGWSPRLRLDLIVNTLTAQALVHRRLVVWGGQQERPQIHIQDLTDYFVALLEMPTERIAGRIYNAGGENATIARLAETIRGELDGALQIEWAPARDDERSYHVSSERLRRELGLEPTRTVRDAVGELVGAYRRGDWADPDDDLYHNVRRMRNLAIDRRDSITG